MQQAVPPHVEQREATDNPKTERILEKSKGQKKNFQKELGPNDHTMNKCLPVFQYQTDADCSSKIY